MSKATQHRSRIKLLQAALNTVRLQGYTATTVDNICAAAQVTKGSFFHHFKSKEELVLDAVTYWNEWTGELFAQAPYHQLNDPRDRILGYVDLRMAILQGNVSDFTCLLGTLVQEVYSTHPALRDACDEGMTTHIATLTSDITAAKKLYAPSAKWTPESVGYFIQAVLQGAFIFAKAKQGAEIARTNLMHLRSYLETLFPLPCSTKN